MRQKGLYRDRGYVLKFSKNTYEGKASDLLQDSDVRHSTEQFKVKNSFASQNTN